MSAVTTEAHHDDHAVSHELPWPQQLRANRLGLWLFCISEIFLFLALLAARFYLWGGERPELSQGLGLITTTVLLVSSFFVYRGETAMEHGDRKTFLNSFMAAAVFGLLFFVGVVFLEWNVFGLELNLFGIEWFGHLKPTDGVFGGVFYAMTGMHALHVLSGLVIIYIVWNLGRKGHFTPEKHWGVEAAAIYWHYVDVVWVFFYPALYLIGKVVHG
ncbi:MAG: heme-copper oxidase subunit III [Ardenticatenaceae bacterium]|nr:heme-copper oxidase subunit III [Anaerolineales bacterium]MCB8976844.1 heme-copper oxidase subunit III [Ardenticatenaceae bacterium]